MTDMTARLAALKLPTITPFNDNSPSITLRRAAIVEGDTPNYQLVAGFSDGSMLPLEVVITGTDDRYEQEGATYALNPIITACLSYIRGQLNRGQLLGDEDNTTILYIDHGYLDTNISPDWLYERFPTPTSYGEQGLFLTDATVVV